MVGDLKDMKEDVSGLVDLASHVAKKPAKVRVMLVAWHDSKHGGSVVVHRQ